MSIQHSPEQSSELDVDEIKHFYDTVYYADAKASAGRIKSHYTRLLRKLDIPSDASVLDVACGTGGWLQVCNSIGCRVSGIDLSEKAIEICQQVLPDGEFHAQPAENLPFADGQFDIVTCLGSLEHFVDPQKSLREMVRVARDNALFVILVPNKDFLTRRLGLFGGTYQVDAREVVRTLSEWQALFEAAGLHVNRRWRDLHVINRGWITQGRPIMWPLRLVQALMLPLWPLGWQYQVYHSCSKSNTVNSSKTLS